MAQAETADPRAKCTFPSRPLMLFALLAMVLAGAVHAAQDDDYAPITPYRPSVSTPAQLPAPGQLEFELGGQRLSDGGSRRTSPPYLFKLAFNSEWGVLVGGEPYVWTSGDAGRFEGVGDTNVTLKRAWIVNDATAFGMEFTVKVPTASEPIGSGKADYEVNTIYSQDFGPMHMDANLNATQLGQADLGSARTQFGGATSFSVALPGGHWGLIGEVSGTHRSGADNGLQFLSALTFSPTKYLTFDMGLARAIRPRPATTALFAGMVLPLARFW